MRLRYARRAYSDIAEIHEFMIVRFPYLLYHRVIGDELVINHVRDGRRGGPGLGELS